ncbi:hypothetical protein EDD11_000427 [Mortierella claussenii]|nr:hypothetical protein EDD11_000427 [Mortierella claussenii]
MLHSTPMVDRNGMALGDSTQPFRFNDLPVEVQLQVVQFLNSERELLQFRLVSKHTNALVLDPEFWRDIEFSKQQCFKTGSAAFGPRQPSIRRPPSFFHSSDANIMLHSQSWAASMLSSSLLQSVSSSNVFMMDYAQPSLTIVANLSRSNTAALHDIVHRSTSAAISGTTRSWQSIETSFSAFLFRLASQEYTAHGVHRIVVEDWEDKASMTTIFNTLSGFVMMRDISIRKSILLRLFSTDRLASMAPWEHLTRLDLRDCQELCDLTGVTVLMPNLEDLCLEGCAGLMDFTPLAPRLAAINKSTLADRCQPDALRYRIVNLTRTKIQDSELIQLLEQSPRLQELRIDQCYQVTVASLVAIGYGHKASTTSADPMELESQSSSSTSSIGTASASTSFCPELQVLSLKNCYDLPDDGVRALVGCRQLERLIIRGLRHVDEETLEWLHSQGVPLRKALSPLGHWRHWHV